MSSGVRIPATAAREVAGDLIRRLGHTCERLEVAGSLRRGAADVGDLELVAMPAIVSETVDRGDLWGTTVPVERDRLAEELELLRADGLLAVHPDRPAGGERYQRLVHVRSGLQVDIFSVRPPASWGVIFLIRTGPAAYSQAFVTDVRRLGFHVRDGALHRGSLGCGAIACEVIPTPEEEDVYRAVGRPWIRPEDRR